MLHSTGANDYADYLRRRLHDDTLPFVIPLGVRSATAHGWTESHQLMDLVQTGAEKRIVVLGNPGAGKSTLVRQLCLTMLDSDESGLPVYLELKRYQPDRGRDVRSLYQAQLRELQSRSPGTPVSIVVLDGLNEVAGGNITDAFEEIEELADSVEMSGVLFILTCRSVDYPTSYWTSFAPYSVVPVNESLARVYLVQRLGNERAERVWGVLPPRMKSLCGSPLLLGMLAFVLQEDGDGDEDLPRNRTAIYARFLAELDRRTRKLQGVQLETPENIREACLAFVAYRMRNERVEVPVGELRDLVTRFFESVSGSLRVSVSDFQREVIDLPPMGTISVDRGDSARSFMHQSVQEYYTALHLHKALLSGRIRLSDLLPFLAPHASSWRETFGFLSGMLSDSTELVRVCRRQKNTSLAAFCIENADDIEPAEVDDFICETLDRFKYGGEFSYHLIVTLGHVIDRRSTQFPDRVVDDIAWWAEKYNRADPQEIGARTTDSELIALAADGSARERLDAVWTLGQRRVQAAVSVLEQLALHDRDDLVREHSVIALGKISAPSSFPVLRAIATSSQQQKWIRTYALQQMGSYTSAEAVEVLLDYLEDPANSAFAEDAAWALSVLAENSPDLLRPHVPRLLSVLRGAADRYTKGCVLFAISQGHYTEILDEVIEYLASEVDPYVLEDGSFMLGELGVKEGLPLLTKLADPNCSQDAMTRLRALLALGKMLGFGTPTVSAGLEDPVAFVRMGLARGSRTANDTR